MRKNIFFWLLPVLLLFGLSSCEKAHTCTCIVKDNMGTHTFDYELESSTRHDAINKCDNKAFLWQDKTSVTCSLQ